MLSANRNRRFTLNIRKPFFIVKWTKHWHRLPREVEDSSHLEIIKTKSLINSPGRWLAQKTFCGASQPQPPCESVTGSGVFAK